jgi:hypothetical protein
VDTRAARRAAEKAARDLINNRAVLVGEFGVTSVERGRLAGDVAAAAARGQQLVADAEAEAARLVAAAQDLAQDGEQRYADAYSAATAGGWTAADLTALGFQPAPTGRRRRSAVEQPELAPQAATVPEQPAEHERQPAAAAPQ